MLLHVRTASLVVALFAMLVALSSPLAPPAHAQEKPKVAYVYATDTGARDSFKSELELRGFSVTPITLAQAGGEAGPDFGQYDAIIIAHDTGHLTSGEWLGSNTAGDRISRSGVYTIGVGFGGAQFFDTLDLEIGYANGATPMSPGGTVINPGDSLWSTPNTIPIAMDGTVKLYPGPTGGRFAKPTDFTNVKLITRHDLGPNEITYPLAAEEWFGLNTPTCFLLWGQRAAPNYMTPAGRNLFENLLRGNPCADTGLVRSDVGIAKTGPAKSTIGSNISYVLTVTTTRQAAPGVEVVDLLPANATFVSATPSQGSCHYAPGKVICALGNMPAGATATITIVLKPTEVGTLVNRAMVYGKFEDTNSSNNSAQLITDVAFSALYPPLKALPYLPIFTGPIVPLPNSDLSFHGIEMTQGIQCFDTSKGLTGCANNSVKLVARKSTTARIYLRYTGPSSLMNNVPVRLVLIDTNNVEYVVNTQGRALPAIDQSNAANSANIYFSVNFNNTTAVRYYAIVDPNGTISETNEANNRFPATGTLSLNFTPSKTMKIIGQRLRYHPSGYSGTQYAGGWAVNGGAATWFNQMMPLRSNGINYQVASGYMNWTTSLGNGAGQHALITQMNMLWLTQNMFPWLFGGGAYTGARHVYGWAPNDGYSGGHADMPIYPHAGGYGVVAIGTDRPGTSSDNPGGGALIFAHELVHDYDVKHTDTSDACGSDDSSSLWPYGTSSIQEFGFNTVTGKVYDPSNTHDIMSYCPAGGSKEGWISPYTWNYMFNKLNSASPTSELAETADAVIGVNVNISNPELGPQQATFSEVAKILAPTPLITPQPGDYSLQLRGPGAVILATTTFTLTFKSEYTHHGGDHPGDPEDTTSASAHMVVPWVDGTVELAIVHNGAVIGTRAISANAPVVNITSPGAPATWTAGSNQTITWQATDSDSGTLTYSLFYSRDGVDWDLLAGGLTATSYTLAVNDLAGSAEGRFQVVANDGANVGNDESPWISIPNHKPEVSIMNPIHASSSPVGALLVLQGFASDMEDGMLPDAVLSWSSNRAGDLGVGQNLPVANLAQGSHIISLTATDSAGQTTTVTAQVFIGSQIFLPFVKR